jgi:dihydropteroate synthase
LIKEHLLQWCNQHNLSFRKPLIMGVLNVTPDSFSDAGHYFSTEKACTRALEMVKHGVDIIDIGGESSKPGAQVVSLDEELTRVIPVIEKLVQYTDVCISIDTYKPEVMRAAVMSGAGMINDIYALRIRNALKVAASLDVPICLMHMQGNPQSMQINPTYPLGVISEISHFFEERIQACLDAGIKKTRLILDPGIGFGKCLEDNRQILAKLDAWEDFQLPLLLGVSRKSTIGALLNKPVDDRLIGGLTLAIYAAFKGIGIIRTHDVDETNQVLSIIDCIKRTV